VDKDDDEDEVIATTPTKRIVEHKRIAPRGRKGIQSGWNKTMLLIPGGGWVVLDVLKERMVLRQRSVGLRGEEGTIRKKQGGGKHFYVSWVFAPLFSPAKNAEEKNLSAFHFTPPPLLLFIPT
jgi:hypothetical protein